MTEDKKIIELDSIEVDEEVLSRMGSLDQGVYGVDDEGIYHMWYGSKTYLAIFHGNKKEVKEDGTYHGEWGCKCSVCVAERR